MNDFRISMKKTIKATPEELFDAWTDADQMKQWLCPEPMTVSHASADAKVGGSYRVTMTGPMKDGSGIQDHTAVGTYKEIDRPKKLVLTWAWEGNTMGDEETLLTLVFTPVKDGTEISLTHEGLKSEKSQQSHTEGWTSCLNHLATYIE